MQVFIIHFTSPLFIANRLKNNSLSRSAGEDWEEGAAFMNVAC